MPTAGRSFCSWKRVTAARVSAPKKPVILSLDRAGNTFIGNDRVAPDQLEGRLAELAAEDPSRIVYVRGDRTISYARLMTALGLVNKAGFAKVSLLAEAVPSP